MGARVTNSANTWKGISVENNLNIRPDNYYRVWTRNVDTADSLRMRWRRWLHVNLCGKVWVIFLGTYTCSEFCAHRLMREEGKDNGYSL